MIRSNRILTTALTLVISAAACSENDTDHTDDTSTSVDTETAVDTGEMTAAENLEDLNGIWRQKGYARILEFRNNETVEYHVTDVSCVRTEALAFETVATLYDRILRNDVAFSWYEAGRFTRMDFDRIDELPGDCAEAGEVTDPQVNFEALVALFSENYAYFEERGVDWDGLVAENRPKVNAHTTDEALFGIFQELLTPLDDGHVYVWDGGAQGFLSGSLGDMWNNWAAWFEGEPVTNPIDPRRDFIDDMDRYVTEEVLRKEGKTGLYGTLHWGLLDGNIGYLEVHEFYADELAELPLPEGLAQLNETMSEVMSALSPADGIIVDARFNQGGEDAVGYAIAGWFTDENVMAARKRAVDDSGWTENQEIVIEPQSVDPFTGPVALLTSGNTISAAETFVQAMRELPNVTTFGTNTYGIFSDVLLRRLPNGWYTALSNEVYESPDGSVFEAVGIPPDQVVEASDTLDFQENLNAAIETAAAFLRGDDGASTLDGH